MSRLVVIPDSSFYVCFTDDINKPQLLLRMLNSEQLEFIAGSVVRREIEKAPNFLTVKSEIESKVKDFQYYNYGEILKPVFAVDEICKGEHEVISIAFIVHSLGMKCIAIIDDSYNKIRKFIKTNFPAILDMIKGTVGFVELCCLEYCIFSKSEGVGILILIKQSKFRIEKGIVNRAIDRLKAG